MKTPYFSSIADSSFSKFFNRQVKISGGHASIVTSRYWLKAAQVLAKYRPLKKQMMKSKLILQGLLK